MVAVVAAAAEVVRTEAAAAAVATAMDGAGMVVAGSDEAFWVSMS